jgi:hypothetical protein
MIRKFAGTVFAASVFATGPLYAMSSQKVATVEVATGLTNVGPALLLISAAGALLLTLLFRSPATKLLQCITTEIGKRRVARILAAKSSSILNDFILPGAFGGLTRIDHAILTPGGIICIQTKHCNGIVFGDPDEPQWTNVDGVQKRKFLNPHIQNEGRTKALQIAVPGVPIANLVVFSGTIEFTSPRNANVIHVRELASYIEKFVFGPSKIDDWDAVWLTVNAALLIDEASRKDFYAQLSLG